MTMARTNTVLLGALILLFVRRSSESTSVATISSRGTTHHPPSLPMPTSSHVTPAPSSPPPALPTSTHSHAPSTTPSPSPSPSPSPVPSSGAALNDYILNATDYTDKEPRVCLHMVSRMAITFHYATSNNKWKSVTVPVGADARIVHNKSYCKLTVCAEPTTATLVVEYRGLTVALKFDELEGNKHWSYNSTILNYTISDELFPNLANSDLNGMTVAVISRDSLFDWTTRQLMIQSSYLCNTNTTVRHFNDSAVNGTIRVSVSFSDLHIQAFKFSNDGQFDENESCYADRTIVVPVAVAGALALLASAVIIVSVIRLCWNKYRERKPPKYQRLSAY